MIRSLVSVAILGLAAATAFSAHIQTQAESHVNGAALVGDPLAGRRKVDLCSNCHGADGVAKIPEAPNIGGEDAGYIARQLYAFRRGDRVHETMTVVAHEMTEQDIADLAAWYAALIPHANIPDGHLRGSPELCTMCHGAAGRGLTPDAPNLSGESALYLITQLNAFRDGDRQHEFMTAIAEQMTDEQIRDASEWFAAIGFSTEEPEE